MKIVNNSVIGARLATSIQLAVMVALALSSGYTMAASKIYTFDGDFDLGAYSGVNHNAPNNNQLQLNVVGTTFPVLWAANAGEDTVSKFDTVNNIELARYRTWFGPVGQTGHVGHLGNAYAGPAPSRTSVDIQGNAYVLNRHFDGKTPMVMKILAEGGIDRNGNSVIDTSAGPTPLPMADLNNNGILDPNEITDERVAWAVRVGTPSGLGRAMCIGTDGNLWVGMYNARTYYKISSADGSTLAGPVSVPWTPYGCLIDASGVLWSASLSGVLGKITNTASNVGPYAATSFNGNANYGIALGNGKVYLGRANQQFDPATNTFSAIPNMAVGTLGIVADGAGNIIAGQSTVRKVSPAGALLWQAPLQAGGSSSVGIQVDSNNDVFQIGFASAGRVQKYRGTDGAPLGTFPVGNMPYTYSDATGLSARTVTNNTGTWTVVFDGGANGTPWDKVVWTDNVPTGASAQVSVRAADTQAGLPFQAYQATTNGGALSQVGRFIQIQARLNANQQNQSPVLYDLTVNSEVTTCDIDKDGDVDKNDITLITAVRGQTVVAGDLRDADGNLLITVNDARVCTLKCTRPNCAP